MSTSHSEGGAARTVGRTVAAADDVSALRFETVALPAAPDLLAEAGSQGWLFRDEHGDGVAGRGEAIRLDLPRGLVETAAVAGVEAALAGIAGTDEVGGPASGPVAIGALPFDPTEAGHLIVPRFLYGRRGEMGWLTTVFRAGEGTAAPTPVTPRGAGEEPPGEFRLTPTMGHTAWMEAVAATVETIDRGRLEKVVLARRIDIAANESFVIPDVLERLVALFPACMVYLVEGFLGASPELLVRRTGSIVQSQPLAGTVARSGDAHGDELLVAALMGTAKLRHEHRVVVDMIAGMLGPICEELSVPTTPSVLGLRNVSHLATHIEGRLTADGPSALRLAALLHPTPAVGGIPSEGALRYLQKVEGFDRGRYGGPVGWMDSRGDGCFAVGIRCAEVRGDRAAIYAGNGIVAGSDPSDELAETQLKLQALLAALVRP